MKTTVNLPESLLGEAKRAAREDQTTITAMIEAGLRMVLARRRQPTRFSLRDASVPGRGMSPAFRDGSWEQFRDAIYARRA